MLSRVDLGYDNSTAEEPTPAAVVRLQIITQVYKNQYNNFHLGTQQNQNGIDGNTVFSRLKSAFG